MFSHRDTSSALSSGSRLWFSHSTTQCTFMGFLILPISLVLEGCVLYSRGPCYPRTGDRGSDKGLT